MTNIIAVYLTVQTKEQANYIAKTVVLERLVACANISEEISSIYWWENNLQETKEYSVIFKTSKVLFKKLEARIVELHSYDCPCVVAWDIVDGSSSYIEWVKSEVIK